MKTERKNIMKKLAIIFTLILFCASIFAQEKADSNAYTYCELLGIGKFLSNKVTVTIDFGQATKFMSDNRYKDETGKPVVFNSMIDALNFMGNSGWEFVQAYIIGEGGQYVYHWLLKKRK